MARTARQSKSRTAATGREQPKRAARRVGTRSRTSSSWVRNASDEMALAAGYWFDERRGQEVVDWIEETCVLWEGDRAGELMQLHDWQYDVTMRLFGWVHENAEIGRVVRRFTRGFVWIPKKNKKTPTLAAWGLYLFCGDGEQGQKCFSAAKDGTQAALPHNHAVQMVKRIPHWDREFVINGTTQQISHLPTSSTWKILTVEGDADNKEGINGSILIDEGHVVDERLARVISRAGISRSEPMQLCVSTAGNNPNGWGKKQYDYGKRVEAGEMPEVHHFFHVTYEAPQDTKPEDLQKPGELIRLGRLANPAMGHTVRESEFLADYNESKDSLTALLDFLMYRLDVWQRAAHPWLPAGAWAGCKQNFTENDLLGRECYAGLDLASVSDLNALALAFPWGYDVFRTLLYFWLPEETAQKWSRLDTPIPMLEWAKHPLANLTLTPGSVVQHEAIRRTFRDCCNKFKVRALLFDKASAEDQTRYMSEGQSLDGKIIEPGTGVERLAFPQGIVFFNQPTKDLERLIISGKLEHNGNPVMDWQAGHVAVRRDANDNIKPVKPSKDGLLKIDGFTALVMAVAGASSQQIGGKHFVGSGEMDYLELEGGALEGGVLDRVPFESGFYE